MNALAALTTNEVNGVWMVVDVTHGFHRKHAGLVGIAGVVTALARAAVGVAIANRVPLVVRHCSIGYALKFPHTSAMASA